MPKPRPLLFLSPIHRAIRQIGIHLTDSLGDLDLQPTDGHLVSYLRSYSPVPIGEIARVFGASRSTLTGQLDRLEARGIIRREIRADDRRSFHVHLTPDGRKFAERVSVRSRISKLASDGGSPRRTSRDSAT